MSSNLGMKKRISFVRIGGLRNTGLEARARFGFPVEPQGLVMTRVDLNPTCSRRSAFRYRAA